MWEPKKSTRKSQRYHGRAAAKGGKITLGRGWEHEHTPSMIASLSRILFDGKSDVFYILSAVLLLYLLGAGLLPTMSDQALSHDKAVAWLALCTVQGRDGWREGKFGKSLTRSVVRAHRNEGLSPRTKIAGGGATARLAPQQKYGRFQRRSTTRPPKCSYSYFSSFPE